MIDFGLCHVRETVDLDLGTWLVRFTEGLSELEGESPFLEKETYLQTLWMFPKTMGFPPKSSILIGFSIIYYKPIHFGVPLFLETPICCWGSISRFFGRSTKVNHFRCFYRILKYLNTHVNVPSDEETIEMSTSKIKWNQIKSGKIG